MPLVHRTMNPSPSQLADVLNALQRAGLTPITFLVGLLNLSSHVDEGVAFQFINDLLDFLDMAYERFKAVIFPWASRIMVTECEKEISLLSNQYHISAESITHDQLNSIHLDTLANVFQKEAPNVWNLLVVLFDVKSGAKLLCSQRADVHQASRADASTRREEILNVVCYRTLAVFVLLLTLISKR